MSWVDIFLLIFDLILININLGLVFQVSLMICDGLKLLFSVVGCCDRAFGSNNLHFDVFLQSGSHFHFQLFQFFLFFVFEYFMNRLNETWNTFSNSKNYHDWACGDFRNQINLLVLLHWVKAHIVKFLFYLLIHLIALIPIAILFSSGDEV